MNILNEKIIFVFFFSGTPSHQFLMTSIRLVLRTVHPSFGFNILHYLQDHRSHHLNMTRFAWTHSMCNFISIFWAINHRRFTCQKLQYSHTWTLSVSWWVSEYDDRFSTAHRFVNSYQEKYHSMYFSKESVRILLILSLLRKSYIKIIFRWIGHCRGTLRPLFVKLSWKRAMQVHTPVAALQS